MASEPSPAGASGGGSSAPGAGAPERRLAGAPARSGAPLRACAAARSSPTGRLGAASAGSGPTARALSALEFPSVLQHLASFATTGAGRDAVLAIRPAADAREAAARLRDVTEARRFLALSPQWSLDAFADPASALARLALDGSVLAGADLARLAALVAASRSLRRALADGGEDLPGLAALRDRLFADAGLAAALARAVGGDGRVLDTASKELVRLRSRLAGAHQRVVAHLESVLGGLSERYRVADASVAVRDGRYVIPVRREGRRTVGGYVHDESASGATVFVEPPSAIAMTNALRETERAEAREVQRVLRGLTGRCRPFRAALSDSLAALVEMDRRVALAAAANEWDGHAPEVAAGAGLTVRSGRHPLLVAAGADPVPFDLDLPPQGAVVVVTGPNAGGKTVFLKSVGLISAMAQAGIVPPVGPGTRLPAFRSLFADIGDQQSISDNLSTFSAHLRNLRDVLAGAAGDALVLVDEPGAGTDPREGEALARALVETLAERGCAAVITSHLGGLKRLAAPGNRIANASLEFDAERMSPTYRFLWGRPGRSYGLAMARALGFPAAVLDRAERCRDGADARLDDLLSSLQRQERRASRLAAELERERAGARSLREELERRETALREAEEARLAEARVEARRLLLEARRDVEKAIAGLEARVDAGQALESAAREARQSVESAARELLADVPSPAQAWSGEAPEPGDWVTVAGSGARGCVVAVEGGRAVVDAAGLRITVPLDRLQPSHAGPSRPVARRVLSAKKGAVSRVSRAGSRPGAVSGGRRSAGGAGRVA